MNSDVITVETKTSIFEARSIMRKKRIKRLSIMNKGKLIGLVTKNMILEASPSSGTSLDVWELNYLLTKMKVDDIMVKDPMTIPPDYPLEDVIWLGKKEGGLGSRVEGSSRRSRRNCEGSGNIRLQGF